MKLSLPDISIRSCLLALASALILPVSASHADIITLTANLTGALEVPPTGSPGTGQATVILNTTAQTMEVKETFSGLVIATSLETPIEAGMDGYGARSPGVNQATPQSRWRRVQRGRVA